MTTTIKINICTAKFIVKKLENKSSYNLTKF